MPVSLNCPEGHRLTVSRRYAGKTVRCPECGQKVRIPSAEIIERKLREKQQRQQTAGPPPLPSRVEPAAATETEAPPETRVGRKRSPPVEPPRRDMPPPKSRPREAPPRPAPTTRPPREEAPPAPSPLAPAELLDAAFAEQNTPPPPTEPALTAAAPVAPTKPRAPKNRVTPPSPARGPRLPVVETPPVEPAAHIAETPTFEELPTEAPPPPEPVALPAISTPSLLPAPAIPAASNAQESIAAPAEAAAFDEVEAPPQVAVDVAPQGKVRGYEPERERQWTSYSLGISLALIGVFGAVPAALEIAEYLRSDQTIPVARWAWLTLLATGVQLAYAVYAAQLRDWSTAWVVTFVGAGLAAFYAALLGLTLLAGAESRVVAMLELEDQLAGGRAARWCFVMLGVLGLFAYFGGRAALRWRHAFLLTRPIKERAAI